MSDSVKTWKVGELAQAAGLTVRALHHYDQLGLLVPSARSFAGYRLYNERDVRRLYRIVALRRLGLGLDAIATALDGDELDLGAIVARQLEVVERQQEAARPTSSRPCAVCGPTRIPHTSVAAPSTRSSGPTARRSPKLAAA